MTEQALEVAEVSEEEMKMKEAISVALNEMFQIPANQLALAKMFLETSVQAIALQQQEEERRYARPVLVRTYYPGSIKATVTSDPDNVGEFLVALEEEHEGEFKPMDLEPAYQAPLTQMVLSQAVQDEDIWYITTNGAIENNLESVANMFSDQLKPGK